jgi:hypothetical protein
MLGSLSMRAAAHLIFLALVLVSCRRHPPPPAPTPTSTTPIAVSSATPVDSAIPIPPPVAPVAGGPWEFVQAVGVSDVSILISLEVGSHDATTTNPDVPLPPGFTAQTVYMVVDLADGCVRDIEKFPMVDEASSRTLTPDDIAEMNDVMNAMGDWVADGAAPRPRKPRTTPIAEPVVGPPRVLPIVNGAVFHEQFVREQKLLAQFDARSNGSLAWSEDGTRALLAADDQMYRSDDGMTFSVIDVNASYTPLVTRDGRFGIYRRCSHPCGGGYRLAQIALGRSSTPRFVTGPDMHDFAFEPGDKSVVFARALSGGTKLCIERLDLDHGNVAHIACEPTGEVISESLFAIADDASFGALQTEDKSPGGSHLVVYDLRTGARAHDFNAMANVPPIDGHGRIGLDLASGDAQIADDAGIRSVGSGEPLAWDHADRLVLLHREALTATPKCGVVSVVEIPNP